VWGGVSGVEDSGQFAGSVAVESGGVGSNICGGRFRRSRAAANGGFSVFLADRVTGDVGGEGVGSRHWMEESGGGESGCLSGWANTGSRWLGSGRVVHLVEDGAFCRGAGELRVDAGSARVGRGAWAAGGDHFGWSLSLNLES